jgi:hypothetical protein
MSQPNAAPHEVTPATPLVPFTCPWAQDGLRKALEGMGGSSSGIRSYKVGTRQLEYQGVAEQGKAVDYWMKMVEFYCGADALPPALTGRDTAFRVIPRDV